MRRVKQIAALLLAVLMLLALAACGKSGEQSANPGEQSERSGKSGDKQAPKETSAPEFVYTAGYETLNLPEKLGSFYPYLVTEDGFLSIVGEKVGERELYEGEELTWDGQLDIYENRLYKLNLDGKLTKLEGYEQMKLDNEEIEEGHEISSGTNYIVAREGGYLTLENVWESWSNAPEGTERYSDEWYMSMQYRQEFYLRRLDETGKELSCVKLDTDTISSNGEVYFYNMAAAGDDKVLMLSESGLFLFDAETGMSTGKIEGIDWAQNLLTLRDGRVMVAYYGDQGQRLSEIDLDKGKLGESYPVNGDFYNAVTGGGDYDIYYTNGVNFYGFDVDTGKIEKLFNWINCDVDSDKLNGFTVTADGKIVGIYIEWDKNYENAEMSFVTMNKVPYDSLPHKETLTLAVQWLDYNARSFIIDFNRKHDNVRIELQDYSEYNTNEDYEAGLTKLRTEMLAGNVPDIIDLSGLPAKQFAAKGLLADLYPLLDADPELSREDFFPAVLKAMENDGKLYATCSSFEINSAIGASRVVGSEPGWTYQQLMDALKEMPEGCTVFSNTMTRYDILQMCLMLEMDRFVDWNTGEVSFDSQAFIDLLNFTKNFPAEFDWENYEWSEEDDGYTRIREGRQLLINGSLYGFDSLSQYENIFGGLDGFTFIGYPTSEGVGNMMSIGAGYAISETCRNKEAAWEFVRTFLTEDYQNGTWGFPSNIHSYEAKRADAMTPTYVKDADGHIVINPETGEKEMEWKGGYWDDEKQEYVPIYAFSEEEILKIEEIINSTDRVMNQDTAIFDIVKEQIDAFYSGQRSAEDVAKLIQSKARIYVNEQR